jgi:hypothetical protein
MVAVMIALSGARVYQTMRREAVHEHVINFSSLFQSVS